VIRLLKIKEKFFQFYPMISKSLAGTVGLNPSFFWYHHQLLKAGNLFGFHQGNYLSRGPNPTFAALDFAALGELKLFSNSG